MSSHSLAALRLHAQTGMFVRKMEKELEVAREKSEAPGTKPHTQKALKADIKYFENTIEKLEKHMKQKGGARATRRRKNRKSKQSRRR